MGYDNAHAVLTKGRKIKTRTLDHRHFGRLIETYRYKTAGKLLNDFFTDVDQILNKEQEQDQGI